MPAIVSAFDFTLEMPAHEWKTINYWFVKPEKFPVRVHHLEGDNVMHEDKVGHDL